MNRLFVFCGMLLVMLSSCDKGEALPNQAPETKIFVDEINLSSEDRLNSIVQLHWLGEDIDGYVKGYELSFDGQNWDFTTETDSVFVLDIPLGDDTIDIDFYVRAIDNQDLADPDPAYLLVPIRNSPPVARFDSLLVIPDTVLGAWSVLWSVNDLDGNETIDSVFIRVNDGPWFGLNPLIDFVRFVPENATTIGDQQMQIFAGLVSVPNNTLLPGLNIGGMNQMYLRARDIAGEFSEPDTSVSFYFRQQKGDLLVLDAHKDSTIDPLYREVFESVYPSYDYVNLQENIPPFWEPTFDLLLSQYDKVFWYGDEGEIDGQLFLERASSALQTYLNNGGKIIGNLQISQFSDG